MPLTEVEGLLRTLAPQVLGAVVRRYGHFDTAEDAVQEALLAAATQWPTELPGNPLAWLITVASRRLTDLLRNEQARQRRENRIARWALPEDWLSPAADRPESDSDDTLILLFLCCHPSLSVASQIALTLRAVGGLTTAEIARAFLVPEATMARRISRAKQTIKDSGVPFAVPQGEARRERLGAVLHTLYLIFNEGYASTYGPDLQRTDLAAEAIRLTRLVHRLLRDDCEVTGLLALMLLTDARRPARSAADGGLVLLAEQDRRLWDSALISEGVALISSVLPRGQAGPYQIQAAIAAVHDEAPSYEETDWAQIAALYDVLLGFSDNPVTALNRVVAVAMARGAAVALPLLDDLSAQLGEHYRYFAVRGHLLEMVGNATEARAAYQSAGERATSMPMQRYLFGKAASLAPRS
ncbi:RNA polymerase sigma factor [Kibdelosporangium persicum]|uniref:RNA polymerase sigma factor n=1 Tax=Kibdelosporangium persicum TaxID=2698649 RepID=A0ABX2F102_9PSEU|nr:sigma-70 family RNA polymerase sigma factor [Kibdelosporangium persicum]NRN64962.1 RNA polymerase sigma factor [Kibdelosporangium persicum]